MSVRARHSNRPARSQRLRAAERSRRADEGTVTEMARLLLREAGGSPAGGGERSRVRLAGVEQLQDEGQVAEAA